jgi:arylsulfatase A-like enzyme
MTISPSRPNILLITSDQHHWNAIGYNNPEVHTPNLDRLAADGMIFDRAYCPNPTCTPTRASLITGKYPSHHGAYALGTKLPESEHTVGKDFTAAGYRTALVGKAHFQQLHGTEAYPSLESYPLMQDLDFWRDFHGPFYGFDHVELARNHTDEAHVGQHYAIWMEEKGLDNWRDYYRSPTGHNDDQVRTWDIPEAFHYDAWIAERTNALMSDYAEAGENFFLWASFFDPHPKYLVPEPWDTMYDPETLTVPTMTPEEHENNPPHFRLTQQTDPDFSQWREPDGNALHGFHSHRHDRDELAKDIAIYYGMISLMDKYIGKILDQLDALGLSDTTLVIFTTDHGHFYGQHGLIAKGAFHYEDMIRVPMVARFPGHIPAGRRIAALQTLVDYPQTFLSFAGLPAPRTMTGVDQSAVWMGDAESARDHIVVENRHQPTTLHLKTYVNGRYKITVYYGGPRWWSKSVRPGGDPGELFDLQEDPGEVHNLWDSPEHADLKARLVMALLQAEFGKEPLWMPRVAVA